MQNRIAIILYMLFVSGAAGADSSVRAWIETQAVPGGVRVIPYAQSQQSLPLRYELTSTKAGRSGRSNSRQSGQVVVECCAPKELVKLNLSVHDGEQYTLSLHVYNHGTLVAEDHVVYPAPSI